MKIGVLNPIDFFWKDENPQIFTEALQTENERLRQVHPFATTSMTVCDRRGKVLKELVVNDFGYSIDDEIGKI